MICPQACGFAASLPPKGARASFEAARQETQYA
jgi:hypothetical protein